MGFKNGHTVTAVMITLAMALGGVTACGQDESSGDGTVQTVVVTSAPSTTIAVTTTVATTAPPTQPPDPTTAEEATATPPPTGATTTAGGLANESAGDDTDNGETGDNTGNGGSPAPTGPGMTIEAITALIDPNGESSGVEAVAWGDVDGDGDDDAVVRTGWCGASCGTQLDLVIDNDSTPTVYVPNGVEETFAPWYRGAGAAQSSLISAAIGPGSITLVGTGLCGDVPVTETDEPGSCNYDTERTATYSYSNGVVEAVAVDPEPG